MTTTAYQEAGVDIDAGNRAVELMKDAVRSTFTPNVLADVGSFGGLFALTDLPAQPVLVGSIDGVGTKVKLAAELGRWQGDRPGPGQPLRQRHPGAERPPALLSRLYRLQQARPAGRRRGRHGDGRGLPRRPLCPDRRRDGRDAGRLCRGCL